MIKFLKEFCRYKKIDNLNGKYIKTEKNLLCYKFLKKINIVNDDYSLKFSDEIDKINLPKVNIIKPI